MIFVIYLENDNYYMNNMVVHRLKGECMKIGSKIRSKTCPSIIGTITELHENKKAVIKIDEKGFYLKELWISLEGWEECK